MPEAYTHLRTARAGAALAQMHPADPVAFAAGANGPDMLFCYRAWLPAGRRGQDLPALGRRLHEENTGRFLYSLLQNARTAAQRSYALGFLSHYAADCTLHPYVAAVTAPGQLYGKKGGHGYFEAGLDSWLHRQDTGAAAVPPQDCCPRLVGAALAEVGALLQTALRQAYGLEVTREALADTFHHTWYLRHVFVSRWGGKKALLWLVEPLFGGRGAVTGHVTPARLRGMAPKDKHKLPAAWRDPFTGEQVQGGIPELLARAERRSAAYMLAARGYWQGKVRQNQLQTLLGSASYTTGQPNDCSLGKNTCA